MEGNQTRGMKTEMPEPTYHSGTYAYLGTHKDTVPNVQEKNMPAA